MSVIDFRQAVLLAKDDLSENDFVWFPRWISRYSMGFRGGAEKVLPVNRQVVIKFSRSLLERGAPAWQRWQAVRAIECYRDLVLRRKEPDLSEVIAVLAKLGRGERNIALNEPPTAEELVALQGKVNRSEHPSLQTMRREMRVLHYAMSTERSYTRWVKQFGTFVGSMELESFNEMDIGTFLTSLAVDGNVSASTQNQAKSGLLFYYQCVLGKQIGFIDAARVKRPETLPVWFSREEIAKLDGELFGVHHLMFLLIYGSGLRHKECRRLRIKDVCFDQRMIVVRNGKGEKDRVTCLPENAVEPLQKIIKMAKRVHEMDVQEGFGEVYMPYALSRKFGKRAQPNGWKWVFPSRQRRRDPRSGKVWRHHIDEKQFANALNLAQHAAGIDKEGVPHSLRHSFATHLVQSGTDIATVQELMGHKEIETTRGYVHVQPVIGSAVKSPADSILVSDNLVSDKSCEGS